MHIMRVQGHARKVTSACWSLDDLRLASADAGGNVYQWKISTRSRMVDQDFVGKRLERCQVALSPNGNTTAVTAADGRLLLVKGSPAAVLTQPHVPT